MTCTELTAKLDDYVDGHLQPADSATLAAHIESCADCRKLLDSELRLRESLKDYGESSMPQPDAAFFDCTLLQVAQRGTRRQRNRWVMTGVGGTIAAGLVLWMLGCMFFNDPSGCGASSSGNCDDTRGASHAQSRFLNRASSYQCHDDRGPATRCRSSGVCRATADYLDDQPYRRQERIAVNTHRDIAAGR